MVYWCHVWKCSGYSREPVQKPRHRRVLATVSPLLDPLRSLPVLPSAYPAAVSPASPESTGRCQSPAFFRPFQAVLGRAIVCGPSRLARRPGTVLASARFVFYIIGKSIAQSCTSFGVVRGSRCIAFLSRCEICSISVLGGR